MNSIFTSRYYSQVPLLHCVSIIILAVTPSHFLSLLQWDCMEASRMSSVHPALLTTALVVLMAILTSSSRSTRWPNHQSTKKLPRGGGSSGGAGGGGFGQAAAMTHLSSMFVDETTEVAIDTHSLVPTDSTTYSMDSYPTDFHVDAVTPPGNNPENYTLDYNECFFNMCECCPPVKGVMGPMGERGPSGPPGERGPKGKISYCFQGGKKTFGCQKSPKCSFL